MDTDAISVFVVGLLIITLVAASGALSINGMRTTVINTIATSSVTNETITLRNSSQAVVSLNNNFVQVIGVVFVNATGAFVVLPAAQFNTSLLNSENGARIVLNNNSFVDNTSLVSYTFRDDLSSVAVNLSNNALLGLDNTTDQLGTGGTVIGVALILTIIMGSFVFYQMRK